MVLAYAASEAIFFSRFLSYTTLGGLLIRVDVDPVKLSDHYGSDVCVWSDARSALHSINQALAGRAQDAATPAGWRLGLGGAAKIHSEIDSTLDSKARATSPRHTMRTSGSSI